jgi:NhaP-type Na+/H+ or K+/H+ antiporter
MAAVSTIVGVLLASAVLGWALYLLGKHMDRADRDTRYRIRWLLICGGVVGVLSPVIAVWDVATGEDPIQAVAGLLFPLLFAGYVIREARRTKLPPDTSPKT